MNAKKRRLDQKVAELGLVSSRSQAENYIRRGKVKVNDSIVKKPGALVGEDSRIALIESEVLVSRAGHKLAGAAAAFELSFQDAVVLDVGSSTGGFTDYVLKHGAAKVIAVDVGTEQLHPLLRGDPRIELHEKTDIRSIDKLSSTPDYVLIDVSFISLRYILPHISTIVDTKTHILAMCKPQFEAGAHQTHKGVIKNSAQRRSILKAFEMWLTESFQILNKKDSDVPGTRGNIERFYLLKRLS